MTQELTAQRPVEQIESELEELSLQTDSLFDEMHAAAELQPMAARNRWDELVLEIDFDPDDLLEDGVLDRLHEEIDGVVEQVPEMADVGQLFKQMITYEQREAALETELLPHRTTEILNSTTDILERLNYAKIAADTAAGQSVIAHYDISFIMKAREKAKAGGLTITESTSLGIDIPRMLEKFTQQDLLLDEPSSGLMEASETDSARFEYDDWVMQARRDIDEIFDTHRMLGNPLQPIPTAKLREVLRAPWAHTTLSNHGDHDPYGVGGPLSLPGEMFQAQHDESKRRFDEMLAEIGPKGIVEIDSDAFRAWQEHAGSLEFAEVFEDIEFNGLDELQELFPIMDKNFIRNVLLYVPAVCLEQLKSISFRDMDEDENIANPKETFGSHLDGEISINLSLYRRRIEKRVSVGFTPEQAATFENARLLRTLVHEVGHETHDVLPTALLKKWLALTRKDKTPITPYVLEHREAGTVHQEKEDWADSFTMFHQRPRVLELGSPKRDEVMQEIHDLIDTNPLSKLLRLISRTKLREVYSDDEIRSDYLWHLELWNHENNTVKKATANED